VEVRLMKIVENADCPFSGSGLVIAWPYENFVRLMHPLTLEEWTMPVRDRLNQQGVVDKEGFVNSTGDSDLLWPVNQSQFKFDPAKMVDILRHSYQRACLYGKGDGMTFVSVREALRELQNLPAEAVEADLKALEESTRSMHKPRGTKPKQLIMEGTMAAKKKSSSHREGIEYLATQKLDPEKFRGQRQLVAKALGSYSTPKSLEIITEKVKANGGYKVNADGGLADSVHYHLRELVKMNLVKESKDEKPEPKASKKKETKETKEPKQEEAVEAEPALAEV
jgi:hypothetical protein